MDESSGGPGNTATGTSVSPPHEPHILARLHPSDREPFIQWLKMWHLLLKTINDSFGDRLKGLPLPFGILLGIIERDDPTRFLKKQIWGPSAGESIVMDDPTPQAQGTQSTAMKRDVWKQKYERLRRLTQALIDDKQDNFMGFGWAVRKMEARWNIQGVYLEDLHAECICDTRASIPLVVDHDLGVEDTEFCVICEKCGGKVFHPGM